MDEQTDPADPTTDSTDSADSADSADSGESEEEVRAGERPDGGGGAAEAKRRRRIVRRSFPILVLILIAGMVAAIEWWFDPWIEGLIRGAIGGDGMVVAEETEVSASLLGASVVVEDFAVHDDRGDERRTPYRAGRIAADLGLGATLAGPDVVIDELAVEGVVLDLRKREEGPLPGLPEEATAEDSPETGIPIDERDLLAWYRETEKWRRRLAEWDWWEAEEEAAEEPQPADEAWGDAKRYVPPPSEDDPPGRIVVARLAASVVGITLPETVEDEDGEDLLRFESMEIEGEHLALHLFPGETMTLEGSGVTAGAGSCGFDCSFEHDRGEVAFGWKGFPLALLSHPRLAGRKLDRYGISGRADCRIAVAWGPETPFGGTLVIDLHDLRLDPAAGTQPAATRLAEALDRLDAETVTWKLAVAGDPSSPRVEDFGFGSLLDTVARLALERGKEELANRLGEHADEWREKAGVEIDEAIDEHVGEEHRETVEKIGEEAEKVGEGLLEKLPGGLFGGGEKSDEEED